MNRLLLLAAILSFHLAACSKKSDPPGNNEPDPTHNTPATAEEPKGSWQKDGEEWVQSNFFSGQLLQEVVWQGQPVQLYHGGSSFQGITRVKISRGGNWEDIDAQVNGSFGNIEVGADDKLYHYYEDNGGGHHLKSYDGNGSNWTEHYAGNPGSLDMRSFHRLGNSLYRFLLFFNRGRYQIDRWSGSAWQSVVDTNQGVLPYGFRSMRTSTVDALPGTVLVTFNLAGSAPEGRRFYAFDGSSMKLLLTQPAYAVAYGSFVIGRGNKWYYVHAADQGMQSTLEEIGTNGSTTVLATSPDKKVWPFGNGDGDRLWLFEYSHNLPNEVLTGILCWDGSSWKRYGAAGTGNNFFGFFSYFDLGLVNGQPRFRSVYSGKLTTQVFRQ